MKLTELPPKLGYAVAALASVLVIGTVFYHYFEHWRWIDAAFFATYTITTVGYNEIAPLSDSGKIFTIAYMLVGIGIALYTLSMVGGYYVEQRFEHRVFHAARNSRKQLHKIRCAISPGHDSCDVNDEKNNSMKTKKK